MASEWAAKRAHGLIFLISSCLLIGILLLPPFRDTDTSPNTLRFRRDVTTHVVPDALAETVLAAVHPGIVGTERPTAATDARLTAMRMPNGCQSNCVLHPKPPGGAATGNILQNRVIGYYEAWSARKACHRIQPQNLPLDALTHVNFAFAYIEPKSYKVVPMDAQTPASLFLEVPKLKQIKPGLKVFVSIGGWTFSDNGTVTQPLFGEIAADAGKRQTFADNVVRFMKQYGYDGVDLDWEYPGAPDRGGQDGDVENFVLLLQTMRRTFDSSGSRFGITFTAPSSYWYLRWFDLPGLIKYADWINLMSYDLHGVWDRDNPIGSIVQGHTNLTEIKLAAELFWRVGVPPGKLVMGFGFYGRAFTLSDPDCSKPGCAFKGASDPGPCTGEGGILGHYEIRELLKSDGSQKRAAIEPVYDRTAAVKYATIDGDQWVSFDDGETLKQKVQWANEVGLGGAMIWASDLDDDKYTAHAELLNREVRSTALLRDIDNALSNPQALVRDLAGTNGQDCFRHDGKCVNLNDNDAMADACGSGYTPVGWDDAGCGKKSCHCGKPICCPTSSAPKNCIWRGDDTGGGLGSDCNAQCGPGEVNIKGIQSHWGGGFVNDGNTNRCGRGEKAFCCPSLDYKTVTEGCTYTSCTGSCSSDKDPVFSNNDACLVGTQYYCCPKPVQLKDCRWEDGGSGTDCANAVCKDDELEIARAQFAEWGTVGCSWGRKKAACCKVDKAPPKPASCTHDVCRTVPDLCNGNDGSALVSLVSRDPGPRRHEPQYNSSSSSIAILEKRGNAETYYVDLGGNVGIRVIAVAYPLLSEIFGLDGAPRVLRRFFRMIAGYCTGTAVQEGTIPPGDNPPNLGGLEAEHPIDRQVMIQFPRAAASGQLPSGANHPLAPIPGTWWKDNWHKSFPALAARPAIGGPDGYAPDTPNDRVMECFGSYDYPDPFIATDKQVNGAKGSIMRLRRPATPERVRRLANTAVREDSQGAVDELLSTIRVGIAVFEYMNRPVVAQRFNMVRQQIRLQLTYIEADVPGAQGLVDWWDLFTRDYFELVGTRAQEWLHDVIIAAAEPYVQAQQAGRTLTTYQQVVGALEEMLQERSDMTLPGDDSIPDPSTPGGSSLMLVV
ncbi:hypothetical protein GGS23DRAFT_605878 [Durotheca rogersii]|uniref:uncharacterized protein n=1 Tax=Durotheca rogersii TaxID=419775 RepID=UPI00221E3E41|nr:uncharacterized protein GGS23DRAFT_605878 [Durotheca rogersii]KAI5861929.1 hypothetical protein GGS23DRAFT_605878 [Durotheca rogersii]